MASARSNPSTPAISDCTPPNSRPAAGIRCCSFWPIRARPRRRECSGTIRSALAASPPGPALISVLEQRRVEEAGEWDDLSKDREDGLVKRRAGGEGRRKLGAG